MVVVLMPEQLPELLSTLQDDMRAIHIRGEITAKLNSVITDFDFIVDSWPDYKALVVRANSVTAKHLIYLGQLVSVHSRENTALETLLQTPGIIDCTSLTVFLCVDEIAKAAVTDALRAHGIKILEDRYDLMTVTKDTLNLRPIPEGFKVKNLQPEQAHLVNSLWKYNDGEHSEAYIKDIVTKLLSCCMYNKEGSVVGFALRYHYGAIGMLHVLEEHRGKGFGKGFGKVIMSHLANSCLEKDKEVFALPGEDNIASIKLHEGIGFEKVPNSKRFFLTGRLTYTTDK